MSSGGTPLSGETAQRAGYGSYHTREQRNRGGKKTVFTPDSSAKPAERTVIGLTDNYKTSADGTKTAWDPKKDAKRAVPTNLRHSYHTHGYTSKSADPIEPRAPTRRVKSETPTPVETEPVKRIVKHSFHAHMFEPREVADLQKPKKDDKPAERRSHSRRAYHAHMFEPEPLQQTRSVPASPERPRYTRHSYHINGFETDQEKKPETDNLETKLKNKAQRHSFHAHGFVDRQARKEAKEKEEEKKSVGRKAFHVYGFETPPNKDQPKNPNRHSYHQHGFEELTESTATKNPHPSPHKHSYHTTNFDAESKLNLTTTQNPGRGPIRHSYHQHGYEEKSATATPTASEASQPLEARKVRHAFHTHGYEGERRPASTVSSPSSRRAWHTHMYEEPKSRSQVSTPSYAGGNEATTQFHRHSFHAHLYEEVNPTPPSKTVVEPPFSPTLVSGGDTVTVTAPPPPTPADEGGEIAVPVAVPVTVAPSQPAAPTSNGVPESPPPAVEKLIPTRPRERSITPPPAPFATTVVAAPPAPIPAASPAAPASTPPPAATPPPAQMSHDVAQLQRELRAAQEKLDRANQRISALRTSETASEVQSISSIPVYSSAGIVKAEGVEDSMIV